MPKKTMSRFISSQQSILIYAYAMYVMTKALI